MKIWMHRKILGFACLFVSILSCPGQELRFKYYGSKEGFVAAMGHINFAQDSLGFLWIGRGSGLYRFDGYTFKEYKRNPKDSLTLFKESTYTMTVDPAGNLWVSYIDALQRYDRNIDGFITFKMPAGNNIRSVFFETAESMWIGTMGTGLFHYDLTTGSVKKYVNPHTDSQLQQERNYIYDITFQKPFIVMGTQDGIWKFHPEFETFSRPQWKKKSNFPLDLETTYVNRIINKGDHYWISTGEGMMKVDTSYAIIAQSPIGNGNAVIDAQGKLWVPTAGGLLCFDPQTNGITNYTHEKGNSSSLPSNRLVGIFIDKNQNIWLGLEDGGFCQIKRSSVSIQNYLNDYSLHDAILLEGKKERLLLVSTFNDGLLDSPFKGSLRGLQFSPSPIMPSLPNGFNALVGMAQGKDNVWVGSKWEGAVGIQVNKVTGLIDNKSQVSVLSNKGANTIHQEMITSFYEDNQGNLWVAIMAGGLNRVFLQKKYGEEGSVKIYGPDDKDSTSMIAPGWISGMVPENDSLLWVSSYGGLELFHYQTETFEHVIKDVEGSSLSRGKDGEIFFGTKRGLYEGRKENGKYLFNKINLPHDPFITTVLQDSIGRLWIGTLQGLYCFNRTDNSLLFLNSDDGLANLGGPRATITKEGLMLFPGTNGLSVIDPMSLTKRSTLIKPVITLLKIDEVVASASYLGPQLGHFAIPESVNSLDKLELDHTHKIFSIEFASMDLTAPIKVLYRHQLEGFDNDWVETDSYHRTATYQNLGPGTYHFKVKATNADGLWSDYETTLDIIIKPAPWKTWWAYTGYGFLFVGLLFAARKNIVQRERLKANLSLAKVEQEKEHFELEKAKEVDRVKTSFFTNISHEFRTPLTLIKGPVQNILDQFLNGQKEFDRNKIIDQLKLVQRNSDLLLKLINQLLDLAKLESGSLKVEKTEGEVFGFVRAIASSFHSFGALKNLDITINAPTENAVMLFDKDKVEAVLINLINNAIKFTPAGGSITVIAGLTQDPNILELCVKDTGIGIPPEHQSKIFERFHQVSEAHKEVGTGIGLAFVKQLVELMGGTISVSSEVGKGSEFVVVLPIELATGLKPQATGFESLNSEVETPIINHSASSLKPAAGSAEDESSSKPHILVVEDNTDLRHFIIDSLGDEFNFLEAENGKQGLDQATVEIPDLIISDVMMPEMDGITMTGKIKKDTRTSHIPIIILTAKSSEDSKLSGLSSGADDYLTKPFNKNELLMKVRNGVSRQVKLREKLRAELMSTAPPVHVLSEDEKFLNSVKEKILERLSDEQLSVESLAEDIGMSRVQLYRKISGLTDISVNELIRKLRLQRAAQLLSQNWGPVSQVAYEVGFSNLSYFSKVFKEEFGVLPSEYSEKV